MNKLRTLQQQFQDYILNSTPAVCSEVVSTPDVSVEVRLGIYNNAYSARLIEVLESDFPGLHTLLGDEGFHQFGHLYLQTYPSVYRSIRWFATHLVNFLQNVEPYQQHPALAEMAAFEWEIQHVLDAGDAKKITVVEVAAIPPDQWAYMHLEFHPALRRLNLKWNVVSIWQEVESSEEISQLEEAEWPIPWVLWRSEDIQAFFSSIPVEEAWALDYMAAGGAFGEMCEGLCEWLDEENAGPHAAALLKNWLEQGMIIKVELRP